MCPCHSLHSTRILPFSARGRFPRPRAARTLRRSGPNERGAAVDGGDARTEDAAPALSLPEGLRLRDGKFGTAVTCMAFTQFGDDRGRERRCGVPNGSASYVRSRTRRNVRVAAPRDGSQGCVGAWRGLIARTASPLPDSDLSQRRRCPRYGRRGRQYAIVNAATSTTLVRHIVPLRHLNTLSVRDRSLAASAARPCGTRQRW